MTIKYHNINKDLIKKVDSNEIYSGLVEKCRELIKCDTARITTPMNKMYLIIGFNRNTKDDSGQWIDNNGNKFDFDYVAEKVIASGHTPEELLESVKEYNRLDKISWEDYFKELLQKDNGKYHS
ncbi:MAG: hypothetical protein ACP5N1_02005 [Candidatus Woesearchaeota archaeon]